MECTEAQRRIDQGARTSADPALAAHLTYCAACRAYQERADARLLSALLEAAPAPYAAPAASPRRRVTLRTVALVLIGMLVAWLGFTAGRVAFAAYTIQRNIAAMQVAPTPALRVPTDPPLPAPAPEAPPIQALQEQPEQLPTLAPAPAPTAMIAADPRDPPPTPVQPAYQPSITPVQLPAVDGANVVALPTLMPTTSLPIAVGGGTQRAVTVLFLGSDRRPGEGWTTRSDAIMVARLDPERRRVALLSLPRDLIVPIPGYGSARVNAATVYGDLYPQLGGGTELARRTISAYLGTPIDHVVRADFNAFTEVVNAIGGIEVNVEQELYDPIYPTIDYGYQTVYFPPGPTWMDGETALIYSRIRHMDSNYARNRRQQQVVLAILNQVRSQDPLTQIEMIANLTTALRDDIQTDLSLDQMAAFAWALRGISPDMAERYAIDETMVSEGVLADDPYATFANQSAVAEMVRLFINGP
jgi:LCP family protein required for cell wall assembly